MAINPFSIIRPVVLTDTGGFTRATTATYDSYDTATSKGQRLTAAINTPRFSIDPYTGVSQGLVYEAAAINLALQSNDASSAAWSKTGVTATLAGGATGPDGVALSLVTCTASSAGHCVYQTQTVTVGLPYAMSVDVAVGGGTVTHAMFTISDSVRANFMYGIIDLSDGSISYPVSVSSGNFTALDFKVQKYAGLAVYRVTIVGQSNSATSVDFIVQALKAANGTSPTFSAVVNWTATTADKLAVGSLQIEQGSAATSFIPTTTVAVTRAADVMTAMMLSNIAEPDATGTVQEASLTPWSAGTSYAIGSRVYYLPAHAVYEATVVTTIGAIPSVTPTEWAQVGPTNKWAMFDMSNTTQSVADAAQNGDIAVTLRPIDVVDTLVLDNLDAETVTVSVVGSGYNKTINLRERTITDWYAYFFEPFRFRKTAVFTGLPPLVNITINVVVHKPAGAKCGTCVVGLQKQLGYAQPGAGLGILDYSTKETDDFGNSSVVERPFSKRMNAEIVIDNYKLEDTHNVLAKYRATPLVWLAAGDSLSAMVVYGYYKSFDIVVAYPTQSTCNLEIEGLT